MFNTLEAWFRSGASGIVIMVFIALGTLFYAGAAWAVRNATGARWSRTLETCAFIALAVAGVLFVVGSSFNESWSQRRPGRATVSCARRRR